MTYKEIFDSLSKSKFRSSFHLKAKDINYIDEKGLENIKKHANDFIKNPYVKCFPNTRYGKKISDSI